ncbi:MAG: acyl-CoA dehydrogenase [Deltaproteobacteria bacterium]|nr:acyl-CoA dehydrogenase [Deltaproteobacteria bacterium]
MDLRPTAAEERFRAELRAWLETEVPKYGAPPSRGDWPARRAWDTSWQRKLFDAGYAGMSWPKTYGGREASLAEQLIYYEECARARAPYVGVNFVGLLHGGPTVIVEGTPEQKERHIPYILRGEQVWCQGFSEPGAGSDLASLRTRAERDGDHYVVNGQKIWTSFAQVADYCELLVRTDPEAPKHKGITWLIMPMNLPGIEVRPLATLHGQSEFSEVFLDNVRIPVENRVGAENDGWRVTNVTLRFERGTAFAGEMVDLKRWLAEIAEVARRVTDHGTRAWDDASLRREIGHLQAETDALWYLLKLSIAQADASGVPGIGASAVKLFFTELKQRVGDLGMRVLGRAVLGRSDVAGLPSESFTYEALQSLSMTIAAGSSQIQRNIIGERILGLPKDR